MLAFFGLLCLVAVFRQMLRPPAPCQFNQATPKPRTGLQHPWLWLKPLVLVHQDWFYNSQVACMNCLR